MHWLDWMIVGIPLAVIIGMAFYSQRYARGVVDFLAAGRVAGRYVISVGDLAAGLSVITLVAGSEQNYQTGYGISFWNHIIAPVGVVLALVGLGCVVFALGLLMDADLVRIADTVFSNYDLAKVIIAVEDAVGGALNALPF